VLKFGVRFIKFMCGREGEWDLGVAPGSTIFSYENQESFVRHYIAVEQVLKLKLTNRSEDVSSLMSSLQTLHVIDQGRRGAAGEKDVVRHDLTGAKAGVVLNLKKVPFCLN
jgi:hypothetical protein